MDFSSLKREWLNNELAKLQSTGVSKADIARRLKMLPQQLNNTINGSRGVSDSFIDKFVEEFSINHFDLQNQTSVRNQRGKIPFYDDIATIGGTNELSSDTDNNNARVAEWIDAGDWFPEATSAIRHYGESMVEYPSGSILALKRVNDRRLIINGRNYVVETTEFRITKQLQDDGGDFLWAYSSNRETYPDGRQIHSPIRIPKDTIRHIDMVLGCVQKEYSNGAIPIRK